MAGIKNRNLDPAIYADGFLTCCKSDGLEADALTVALRACPTGDLWEIKLLENAQVLHDLLSVPDYDEDEPDECDEDDEDDDDGDGDPDGDEDPNDDDSDAE